MAAITRVIEGEHNDSHSSTDKWNTVISKAQKFLDKTQEHALQGVNPGGVYQAIWCRDAAYILKDWFLYGNVNT
jgi:hypothetical protein